MPRWMMRKSRADLPDILRAARLRACRNWERKGRTAIQLADVWIAERARRRCVLDREEIGQIVKRVHIFEALDGAPLHWQQNRLTSDRRIEHKGLGANHAALHQQIAGAVHD